ncbi:beta-galactosidase-1-like protein 2 isoform X2 [Lineus longissimus]|uniref:beta-galactosidase-1-like protein 2 isoform X2 n=1 Tax=Lineus longissimus TaxID=88925 RepID=UPI002B4F54AF
MNPATLFGRRLSIRMVGVGVCVCVALYLMYRITFGAGELSKASLQNPSEAQQQIENLHDQRAIKVGQIIKDKPQIREGLMYKDAKFYLEGKNLKIMSGAMHYFRVHPVYWLDRLKKIKACGLNTVETYVPWNMHEEIRGQFNFEEFLNIRRFVELAKEADLHVIIRPGPYICAEWEYGGLPSWLLADKAMEVRTMYQPYLKATEIYLEQIIKQLIDLQYSKGGPIIAWQVENEYGSFGDSHIYLNYLKDVMKKKGVTELMFLSDGFGGRKGYEHGFTPTLPSVVNFKEWRWGQTMFEWSKKAQPDVPLMVGEFWTGWFDHWGEHHHTDSIEKFEDNVREVLKAGAQGINFYMFHGGTNFGFWNGANGDPAKNDYKPTITSYDYDAALNEQGDPTDKCYKIRELMQKFYPQGVKEGGAYFKRHLDVHIKPKAYGEVLFTKSMALKDMLHHTTIGITTKTGTLPMEYLDMNNHGGQGYGFVLYRTAIARGRVLKFQHSIKDRAQVFLNGHHLGTFDWKTKDKEFNIETTNIPMSNMNDLEVLVENLGRVNYFRHNDLSINSQRKGLVADVNVDGKIITHWQIVPLEFKKPFVDSLSKSSSWKTFETVENMPFVHAGELNIPDVSPQDTFVDMTGWSKGVVFINNFNLGRYWDVGPQKTLYLPGPLLRHGKNEIIIFELHKPLRAVKLLDTPLLGPEKP